MGCWTWCRDEPDPTSGLTKRDIRIIKRTWNVVFRSPEVYGMELFQRLFNADPETKKLFKRIQAMDEAEYRRSPQFRFHVYSFMTAFNMIVKKLRQPELIVPMMERLGETHKRHGVPERHFITLQTVLIDFLKNDLKLNTREIDSWGRLIAFIYPILFASLKK